MHASRLSPQGAKSDLLNFVARQLTETGQTPERLRKEIAFAADFFWTATSQTDPLNALAQLKEMERLVTCRCEGNIVDAIATSVKILRFLDSGYLTKLRQNFSAAFLVGSMSYGRFYSISSHRDSASDLDLFLVGQGHDVSLDAITMDDVVVDQIDCVARFEVFADLSAQTPEIPRFLNYKLRNQRDDFQISLTMCSERSFRTILTPQPHIPCVLHWAGCLAGAQNLQHDLARRTAALRYCEEKARQDYHLKMPIFLPDPCAKGQRLGLFNGITTMITPRFEALFLTPEVASDLSGFLNTLCEMADDYEAAGLRPRLCNLHIRRDSFSDLFIRQMNADFEHLRAKQR